jgi:hypothetical protein
MMSESTIYWTPPVWFWKQLTVDRRPRTTTVMTQPASSGSPSSISARACDAGSDLTSI